MKKQNQRNNYFSVLKFFLNKLLDKKTEINQAFNDYLYNTGYYLMIA